jgi:hypothetical protein
MMVMLWQLAAGQCWGQGGAQGQVPWVGARQGYSRHCMEVCVAALGRVPGAVRSFVCCQLAEGGCRCELGARHWVQQLRSGLVDVWLGVWVGGWAAGGWWPC